MEGYWLTYLGRVHRMSGRLEDTRSHQADALALLREIGIKDALGECLCEWGHLKLHDGELADAELDEAILREAASVRF